MRSAITGGTGISEALAYAYPGAGTLHAILVTAERTVPGCCAATVSVWCRGTLRHVAVSQPELADVVDAQIMAGSGPEAAARRTGGVVRIGHCTDPGVAIEFRSVAVAHGIRSAIALCAEDADATAVMGLYATRPHVFDALPMLPALQGFPAHVLSAVENARGRARMEREAFGLRRAMATRPVVERAKGMIMQALNCDDRTALDALRRASQRSNVRMADLAERLVREPPASWSGWLASVMR